LEITLTFVTLACAPNKFKDAPKYTKKTLYKILFLLTHLGPLSMGHYQVKSIYANGQIKYFDIFTITFFDKYFIQNLKLLV